MNNFTARLGVKALVLSTGILAALAVSAIAISDPFTNSKTVQATVATPSVPAAVQRTTATDQRLVDAFAIFRRSRDASDALPARIAGRFDSDAFGSAPALSRRAAAVGASATIFAVPARDRVCMVILEADGQSTSTCQPIASAVNRGMIITAYCTDPKAPSTVGIFGLAPDGATSVDLQSAGRTIAQAPVHANAFEAQSSGADSIAIGNSTQKVEGGPGSC